MKLWLVERNGRCGHDEYDSFVAAAQTAQDAANIHPSGCPFKWNGRRWEDSETINRYVSTCEDWPDPETLVVREIGTAAETCRHGVILGSFNAA